ncbi:MAG: SseB family protein [Chloroflexi bacterium]|nr:SseB family protein [Chloroflexota bacterium]
MRRRVSSEMQLDNSALLAALDAGSDNPEADRSGVFRALAASTLLVMLQEAENANPSSGGIQCIMFEEEGEVFLPVFTDVQAMHSFQPRHPHWTTLPAKTLCELGVQGQFDRIVVNPAGPVTCTLGLREMQSLAEGLIPTTEQHVRVEEETQLAIGMPAERLSRKVLDEMRDAAAAPGVFEVWWFWMAVGSGTPHLGLAVDPPDLALAGEVARRIEPIWRAYKPSNPVFDVLELNHGIRKNGRLLYRRPTEPGE